MNTASLLEPKAIAEYLNVPESWVRARTKPSCPAHLQIPHIKLGKYTRFTLPEVERWIHNGMGQEKAVLKLQKRG